MVGDRVSLIQDSEKRLNAQVLQIFTAKIGQIK